jgi:hypothetical protein
MASIVNGPSNAALTILLAHGVGVGMDTPFMNHIAEGLGALGWNVRRFEFPYMVKSRENGKKSPPNPLPKLQESFEQELKACTGPVVLAGKSMGGRVATTILERSTAIGCIALGYPFHPPGKPDSLRIEHLQVIQKPLLILQGERDPFGKKEECPQQWLPTHCKLNWIPDGEHSFKAPKKSEATTEGHLDLSVQLIHEFCIGLVP